MINQPIPLKYTANDLLDPIKIKILSDQAQEHFSSYYSKFIYSPYEMVKEFHEKFEVPINVEITDELRGLRINLMNEELEEVNDEFINYRNDHATGEFTLEPVNKKKLTKELSDLMYVVIGTAVTFGLPLEEVFKEVHKSNMSKLDENGKVIKREDGKVLKSKLYKEPNLDKYFP